MVSLKKVLLVSCVLLVASSIAAGIFLSMEIALSVCIGGMISVTSFALAYRDIETLSSRITVPADPEMRHLVAEKERKNHTVRFLLRLAVIGVVLFLCIKSGRVNPVGLVIGLSTVVLAVIITAANVLRHFYFGRRR